VVVTTVAMSWLLLPQAQRVPFRTGVGLVLATFAALGLFMLWLVPANTQSGGDLIAQGAGIHVVGRALSAMEGHGGSGWSGYLATLPVYIPVVILGFLPWTIHMPAAVWALWNGRIGERRERLLLWSWIVPTFVMFTLAATKLPHYVFPMFPPVAIAIAATMVAAGRADDPALARWLRIGGWLYLLSGAIGAIAIIAAPLLLPGYVSWFIAIPFALALFAAFLAVGLKQISSQVAEASQLIVFTTPVVLLALVWILVPPVEPAIKAAKPLGQTIARIATPQTQVYGQGYFEPSFVFYVNRPFDSPIIPVGETEEGTARVLADAGEIILVTTEPYLDMAQQLAGDRPFEVVARYEARNVNRGARLQQLVVARRAATAQ
jgi:4-amino-4-deoxy-L-arabinose transferase-like glycosyltransferase